MDEMTKTKSQFTQFFQVGVVFKDMDKAIEGLSSFGIKPFESMIIPPMLGEPLFRGKTITGEIAWPKGAWIGGKELECHQPVEGESIYMEFLNAKGEGIQHLGFIVDDMDKGIAELQKKGIGPVCYGYWEGGGFAYLDTDAVGGIVLELIQGYIPVKKSLETANAFTHLTHIGAVVKELDNTIDYLSFLGIGPFKPMPFLTDERINGKPENVKYKAAVADIGGEELRLIEPVKEKSLYRDFLEKRGEGIHHIGFSVKDLDTEKIRLVDQGASILSTRKGENGESVCLDLNIGNIVVELEQVK
jgi:catechol 2,3-dioxygenase-like lactoylglutathione lyase family enzyme